LARERRNIFFVLFTLSGFSGLIYESIWTHYLKLFLGHAAYAQTLVLAIFMGGMAIGSWLCSRYSGKWRNLLRGYAVTEGVIGICALVFHDIFARSIQLSYTAVIPWLAEPALITAYKWTLSAFLILPQSILLGMTFPLMSAGILRLFPERPGRSVAMLYFTNSIGAAVGDGERQRNGTRYGGGAKVEQSLRFFTACLTGDRHSLFYLRDRLDPDADPGSRKHYPRLRADAKRVHLRPRLWRALAATAH